MFFVCLLWILHLRIGVSTTVDYMPPLQNEKQVGLESHRPFFHNQPRSLKNLNQKVQPIDNLLHDDAYMFRNHQSNLYFYDPSYQMHRTELSITHLENRKKLQEYNYQIETLVATDTYLTKDHNGHAVILENFEGTKLFVENEWTESSTGGKCEDSSDMICPICVSGGCSCTRDKEGLCVSCSRLKECQEIPDLSFDSAVSIQTRSPDGEDIEDFIFMTKNNNIKSYLINERKLLRQTDSLDLASEIDRIIYADYFIYQFPSLKKLKLMFVFFKGGNEHSCYEIGEEKATLNYRMKWNQKGDRFKVWPSSSGKLMIGSIVDDSLRLQVVKVNLKNELKVVPLSELRLPSLEDYVAFNSGQEHYLLLKSKNKIHIYLEDLNSYKLIQGIHLNGNEQMSVVNFPYCGNKAAIITVSEDKIVFYAEKGTENKFLEDHIENFSSRIDPESVNVLAKNYSNFLILRSGEMFYEYQINATQIPIKSSHEVGVIDRRTYSKLTKIHKEFERQKSIIDKVVKELRSASASQKLISGNVRMENSALFRKPVIATKMKTDHMKESIENHHQILDSMQLNDIRENLEKSRRKLKDAVPFNGSDRMITGTKYFYGSKTLINKLYTNGAFVGETLGDTQPLVATLWDLVRLNDSRQVQGLKTFESQFHVTDLQARSLNNRLVNQLVTTTAPAKIRGARYWNGIIVHNDVILKENSITDGLDVSREVIKLTDDVEFGTCEFELLEASGGITLSNDEINSVNLTDIIINSFSSRRNFVIDRSVKLQELIIENDLTAQSVMGISLKALASDLILKTGDINIRRLRFGSEVITTDVKITKTINNEKFPEDLVVKSSTPIQMGSKSFDYVIFGELIVVGSVDFLDTKDCVTKSSKQEIKGTKYFSKSVKLFGDLNIKSNLIKGVNISFLFPTEDESSSSSKNVVVFREDVAMTAINCNGMINGQNLRQLYEDLIYKDDSSAVIFGKKNFQGNLRSKDGIFATSLNNIPIEDFVSTNATSTSLKLSHKNFLVRTTFQDLNVEGLVDDTNITELMTNSLFLDKPNQYVQGVKHLKFAQMPHLDVIYKLNGQILDNILTKTSKQTFDFPIRLGKSDFTQVNTTQLLMSERGTINDKDLSRTINRLSSRQLLSDFVTVKGNVISKSIELSDLNNYKVLDLYALLKTESANIPQRLSCNIAFPSLSVDGAIRVVGLMNKQTRSLKDLVENSISLKDKNVVKSKTEWNKIIVSSVKVGNVVNGMNLPDLKADAVYLDDPGTFSIKGNKKFTKGLQISGNLNTNSVNKKNLVRRMLTKTSSQIINVPYKFSSIAGKNIKLNRFNGYQVDKMREMKKREDAYIRGVAFAGVVDATSLEVMGSINGLSLSTILKDSVKLNDDRVEITGRTKFVEPPIFHNVNFDYIERKPMKKLLKLFYQNKKNFTLESLEAHDLIVSTLNIDVLKLTNSSSDLKPVNIRNKFSLMDDQLPNSLIFDNIFVEKNVYSKTVNGLRLSQDILTKNSEQSIWHSVTLSTLETRNVLVEDKINGYSLLSDFLMKDNKIQVIKHQLDFDRNITIAGDLFVEGKVGHRGLKIPDSLVFLKEDNFIDGKLVFNFQLQTSSVNSSSKVLNGIRFSALNESLEAFRTLDSEENQSSRSVDKYVSIMTSIYERDCRNVVYLESLLKNNLVKPIGYNLVSVLDFENNSAISNFPRQRRSVDVTPVAIFRAFSTVWLLTSVNPESCSAQIYSWDETSRSFKLNYTLTDVGYVVQWKIINNVEDAVTVLAVSTTDQICESKLSSLWEIRNSYTQKLERIQDFKGADKVLVEKHLNINRLFLQTGYQTYLYNMSEVDPQLEYIGVTTIDFIRSIQLNATTKLVIRVWDNSIIDMNEGNVSHKVAFDHIIEDFALVRLNNEILLVACLRMRTEFFTKHYLHIFRYEEFKLTLIDWTQLNERARIFPIENSFNQFHLTSLAVLEDFGSPAIYQLGGKPFIKKTTTFPVKLSYGVWIESFMDPRGTFYLVFGDRKEAFVSELVWVGKKFHGIPKECGLYTVSLK